MGLDNRPHFLYHILTMKLILTQEQINMLLNALALAEGQMEEDGKKEMRDLGWAIHNQSKKVGGE
jgi:hypothetical protein